MSTSQTNKKFAELRTALNARHYERYDEIDITLTALLARYHVALIGPPGTAKSMLVEDLANAFQGEVFKYLLTKYTTPEELYGPVDLKALKDESVYQRVTRAKLPEAEFAFLDEVFKANAAVLNTTLTAMNERQFDNGRGRINIPLVTLIGASNELPEGEELNAMFDRFHFRKVVDYIREPSNFIGMLQYTPDDTPLPELTFDELKEAQAEVAAINVPAETTETVYNIRSDLGLQGIIPSDRRFRQSIRALQAFAWLNERDTASDSDFTILQHMFWSAPQEQKPVSRVILEHTNPIELEAQEVMDDIDDIAQKLNSAVQKAKSNPDEAQNLAKQGIEWFTRTKKFGEKLKKLQAKADKQDRNVPKIEQARNRLVEVARAIGQQTIGLDTFENFDIR